MGHYKRHAVKRTGLFEFTCKTRGGGFRDLKLDELYSEKQVNAEARTFF